MNVIAYVNPETSNEDGAGLDEKIGYCFTEAKLLGWSIADLLIERTEGFMSKSMMLHLVDICNEERGISSLQISTK